METDTGPGAECAHVTKHTNENLRLSFSKIIPAWVIHRSAEVTTGNSRKWLRNISMKLQFLEFRLVSKLIDPKINPNKNRK